MGMVVTIDGPAASGKSSLSRELAQRLGWKWLSTGAFYRGLAFAAIEAKIDLKDVKSLAELAKSSAWEVRMDEDQTRVFLGSRDVTDLIKQEHVGSYASQVSHYPEVRQALLQGQRSCSLGDHGLIAEGRDCGTVVFPSANAKIYLTADSSNRAQRRAEEQGIDQKSVLEAQQIRDQQDSKRKVAPMQVPEEALVLDTTHLNLSEVVDRAESYIRQKIVR